MHTKSIHAAILDTTTGQLTSQRLLDTTDAGVIDFIHTHCNDPTNVRVVYETGPTGYHLARARTAVKIGCDIIATSKLIRPAGDKTKTDKRDAEFLARVAAVGEYTTVRIPTVEEESARDLVRARDDIRPNLVSAKHRTSKLLFRQGFVFGGKTHGATHTGNGCDDAGAGTLAAA